MSKTILCPAAFGGDELVESKMAAALGAPVNVADHGKVRQGGLHNLLPWFVKVFSG
jgi:hypothetical protein